MVNYDLIQEMGNIEKKINLNGIPTLEDKQFKNIEVLDSFTRNFKTKIELEKYLLNYNLIKENDLGRALKIKYNVKGKRKSLVYGITYKDDYIYFDKKFMYEYIMSKSDDIHFLKKLYGRFNNSRNPYIVFNLSSIMNYIRFIERKNVENSELYSDDSKEVIENLKSGVEGFIFNQTNKKDSKDNYQTNYRGLRDLAMFLSRNNKKEILNNLKEEIKTIEKESTKKIEVKDVKVKRKVKGKNIPGQLSFEDMGW